MKTRTFFATCGLLLIQSLSAQTIQDQQNERTKIDARGDTILIVKGQKDIRIKLYERNGNEDSGETEIYDGVFLERANADERNFLDLLPFVPKRKRKDKYEPHISGIYLGFARMPERIPQFTTNPAFPLDLSSSWEFGLNLLGTGFRFNESNWGTNIGLGWGYRSFSIDGNRALIKQDDCGMLQTGGNSGNSTTAPDNYSNSRLRHFFFRIPVQLEFQTRKNSRYAFFNLGPEFEIRHGVKSFTHINGGKKRCIGKGMYVHPVGVNLLVQAGYGSVGLYLRYSLTPFFQRDKGPDAVPYSFGLAFFL